MTFKGPFQPDPFHESDSAPTSTAANLIPAIPTIPDGGGSSSSLLCAHTGWHAALMAAYNTTRDAPATSPSTQTHLFLPHRM